MEKHERDHIFRNITRLIGCTKDENTWSTHLLEHDFVSVSTLQKIQNKQYDKNSYIRELYMECTRTPKYGELVTSLRECNNDTAANILEEIQPPTFDFLITDNGTASIVDVLKEPSLRMEGSWKTIQEVLLSPSKRSSEETNLGVRILNDLKFWIEEVKGNSTTFEKLYESINATNAPAADALLKNKESIRAKCI